VVDRVETHGWTPAQTAEAMGVSRATVYKWLRRYADEGEAGLLDRPSRPHTVPARTVKRTLGMRRRLRLGPAMMGPRLGLAPSTVYGILRRHGLSRLSDLDRTTRTIIRYQRETPGELVHLDQKKLARIPEGGGHRLLGRSRAPKHTGGGYEFVHVAVDDCTRAAYVETLDDETGEAAAGFLTRAVLYFAGQDVVVQAVMTDRGFCYTRAKVFQETLASCGIGHVTTRPYRPQTNGKAERFIRTLVHEWAYAELYRSNDARRARLDPWLSYYNHHRPHTALGGSSPMPFLVNKVCGHYT
jgi:transposase InsO family protein